MEEKRHEIKRLTTTIEDLRKQIAEKDREIERHRNAEKQKKKAKEINEVQVSVSECGHVYECQHQTP